MVEERRLGHSAQDGEIRIKSKAGQNLMNFFMNRCLTDPLVPSAFRQESIAASLAVIAEKLLTDNEKFNLTAITEPEEIFRRHLLDSLVCAQAVAEMSPSGKRLLDVGSGAGFPALPIAAALPELAVLAMDSTEKKCRHMTETAEAAGIRRFSALCGRAEDFGRNGVHRERYDFVTARAVARLPILAELCLPLLAVGGVFIAMKGKTAPEETRDSASALRLLGAEVLSSEEYRIPGDENARYLVCIRKNRAVPDAYPRHYSQIAKKPL